MKKLLLLLAFFLPRFVWADDIAYAVFKDGTLTFKYGSFIPDGETSWDVSDTGTQQFYNQELSWGGQLLHVVFDSSFAQARPKSCFAWFDACKNLEDIKGLEYLNTSEVTSMACMFEACPKLTSLDLTHFDTSNVTDMGNMFAGVVGLTMLDISSFNTAQVTNMNCMFAGSNSPIYGGPNRFRTILVGDGWNTSSVTSSQNMFDYCPYLRGAFGTKGQDLSGFDKTYAVVDGAETPGYLTKKSNPRAYAVFSEGTLTFKYDSAIPDGHNWWNVGNTSFGDNAFNSPEWGGYSIDDSQFPDFTTQITKVVFEPSFVDARPISCFAWFDRCTNLETIEGLEYLNTTKVTNMAWMFEACPKLISLDLTHFDTSNVTDMGNMFAGHEGITLLDLSSFNTGKVTNMMYMFASSSNAQNKLKTIVVGDGWTVANVTNSDKMFDYCDNLVGGNGTKYSSDHNDKTYANIDAANSPGYFSSNSGSTVLTLNVATAGTLSNLISADDKYTISELKLTGNLNGTDLRLIREMAGSDYYGVPTDGNLSYLDMSGATIVAGGNYVELVDQLIYYDKAKTMKSGGFSAAPQASEDNILGNYVFAGCFKLETIKMPAGVLRIGDKAFAYSHLKNVTWPTALTNIDREAFEFCNFTSFTLPATVVVIGGTYNFLAGCFNLTELSVEEGNTVYDSRENCNAIIKTATNELVSGSKNTTIPSTVTSIGDAAFRGLNMTSITIPDGVTSIGYEAFSGNAFTEITIPASVTLMSQYSFNCNNLVTVTVGNPTPIAIEENTFTNRANATLIVPVGSISAYKAADYWKNFGTIKDANGSTVDTERTINVATAGTLSTLITAAEKNVITSLTLTGSLNGEDLRFLREMAGSDYNGVPSDGNLSYLDMSGAAIVAGGNYVELVDQLIYYDKAKTMKSGGFSAAPQASEDNILGNYVFAGCFKLETIKMSAGVLRIGDKAFAYSHLKNVTWPTALTNIDREAFEFCNFTSFTLPATVVVIGGTYNFLAGCFNLTELSVEEGNTVYDSRGNCNAIIKTATNELVSGSKNTTIPSTVTSIGDAAFRGLNMTSITIPDGVTSIGYEAFSGNAFTEITIPASVTSMSQHSFNCNNLVTVTVGNPTPIAIEENTFTNRANATLIVPVGSISAYKAADYWKEFKTIRDTEGNTTDAEVTTEPITFGEKPITTYTTSYNMDFSGTDEIKAYVATGYDYDSGTVWLTRVKDVPAGMPVMIMGTPKETYDIPVKLTSGTYFKNMFVANTTGNMMTLPETTGEMTNYYLKDGIFRSSTGTNTIGAGKCYLQIPTVAPIPVEGSGKKVKLNSKGYASFCATQDLDFTDVDVLKAYAATGYDDATGTIWLTRVKRVSAGTGLLLMGAAEGEYTIPSTSVRSYYANMMVGNISSEPITIYTTSGDMTNYYLSGNMLLKAAPAGTIGNPINPGKAYMQIPSAHVTRSISDDPSENLSVYDLLEQPEVISMQVMTRGMGGDGDTTGIRESVQPEQDSDVYYNLNGQRVENPGKGLYIHNGRKVVIK